MKHLKIKIMSIALLAAATSSMAQSLDKMNWLNEPQQWEIKEGKALVMDVPAKTDFPLRIYGRRRTFLLCYLWRRVRSESKDYRKLCDYFRPNGIDVAHRSWELDKGRGRVRRRQTECKCRSHPPHQRLECSATAGCSSFFMQWRFSSPAMIRNIRWYVLAGCRIIVRLWSD